MDDTPSAPATTTADAPPADGPDTCEPDEARQAELRAAYAANVAVGRPPYEKVAIYTIGELNWILGERGWPTERVAVAGTPRADLAGADLWVDLRGAKLPGANLSGADLQGTKLGRADLLGANLGDAFLYGADLREASLERANLQGASLERANLSGADLREARMDAKTRLTDVKLDARTRLLDIDWQGVQLTRVAGWPKRLGDELPIAEATNRKDRLEAFRDATRSYRNLNVALRAQGLLIPASNYRLREQVLERKALFLDRKPLAWIFSWLLFLVAGYGERPARSLVAYLLVLFSFAGAYFALGSGALGGGTHGAIHTPLAALVFSVTSFHGRGFFPGGLALDDPITVLAALEAVMGLFIEITFIATFTQRFFGSR